MIKLGEYHNQTSGSGANIALDKDWGILIDKAYPDIVWRHDFRQDTSHFPSHLLRLKRVSASYFFSFFKKDIFYAVLNQSKTEMDAYALLASLGLIRQGQKFFTLKKNANTSQISGPKNELAAMNILLKIDIFSALILYTAGDKYALKKLAKRRTEALLTRARGADPSLFSFPVAMDTIQVALPKINQSGKIIDRLFFEECMARTEEICRCIDKSVLFQWYGFGQAAQDMAWRGASKRNILGAAYLADTPHIRSLAMMITDITGLAPHSADSFIGQYSSFCDMDFNARAHEHAMDQEFAWIASQDPIRQGAGIFYKAADRQIDDLGKGKVLGWCADALHISADVFIRHGSTGREALDAAKEAFDNQKTINKWTDLNMLGETIVERAKRGEYTNINEIKALVKEISGLSGLCQALDARIAQIPAMHTPHIASTFTLPSTAPLPSVPKPLTTQIINMPVMNGPTGMGNGGLKYTPIKIDTPVSEESIEE